MSPNPQINSNFYPMAPKTPKETYLNKNFDYSKLTKQELLAILFEHNIKQPPQNCKKDVILEVYKANIYDKIDELKKTVVGSSVGIEFDSSKPFFTPTKSKKDEQGSGYKVVIKSKNSLNQPNNQNTNQPTNQSTHQTNSSTFNQPMKSATQTTSKLTNQTTSQLSNQTTSEISNQPISKSIIKDNANELNSRRNLDEPIKGTLFHLLEEPIRKNSIKSNLNETLNINKQINQPISKINQPIRNSAIENQPIRKNSIQPIKISKAAISPKIKDAILNKEFKSQTPPKKLLEIKKNEEKNKLKKELEDLEINSIEKYESPIKEHKNIFSSPIKQCSSFKSVDLHFSDSPSKSPIKTKIPAMYYNYLIFLTSFISLFIANLVINQSFYNFYFELFGLFISLFLVFSYFIKRYNFINALINKEANIFYKTIIKKVKESSKNGRAVYLEGFRSKLKVDDRVWKCVVKMLGKNEKVQKRKGLVKGNKVDVLEYNF